MKYAGSGLVDFEYLAGSTALEMKRRFIDHAKMSWCADGCESVVSIGLAAIPCVQGIACVSIMTSRETFEQRSS